MRLYSMPSSGNSYKVRLLMALTGRAVQVVDCEYGSDALAGAKAGGALPYGKVPVLVLDDGQMLAESNAILWYLGESTGFVPADPVTRAQMLGWMFWEQYNHEPVIAVRQALVSYPHRAAEATPQRLANLLDRGHALLQVMEDRLSGHDWLVGDATSLADLCLYAYTHTAGTRGGYWMDRFPGIAAWLARIEALPEYAGLSA
ncbi:glutathione S-transferase family protein [Paracoccus spongiarum]|uniref:Glutathione S-transferase family protein n=1 Tax=Paracoccus spongiarum TaxID=3064387 RepID=A0ABT9JEG6_9RHOB|nr:glutathione S-transferase family protein [Paracoccus sp. 2205BS29-5]MDP5307456.1 glutathione S-transferase family protein [Paracoccus sp. 2205BS29-5]